MENTNDHYFNNALNFYNNKDYINSLSIFSALLVINEEDDTISIMIKEYISEIYYQLYLENFKNQRYFSSYELLKEAQNYSNDKNIYEKELLNVEFLRDLRNCEKLLFIKKDYQTVINFLESAYINYPNISEGIKNQIEFDINYATYEYCYLYYDNILCYDNTNVDYLYVGENDENYIDTLLQNRIEKCEDEFFLSKFKKLKSNISSIFKLYNCVKLESDNKLDDAIKICKQCIQDSDEDLKKIFQARLSGLYILKGENLDKNNNENEKLLLEKLNYYNQAMNLIKDKGEKYQRLKLKCSKIAIKILYIKGNNFLKEKKYNEAYYNFQKAKSINQEYNDELYNPKDLQEKIKQIEIELIDNKINKDIDQRIDKSQLKNESIFPKEILQYERLKIVNKKK